MKKIDVAIIQTGGTISSAGEKFLSPDTTIAAQVETKTKEIVASFGLMCQIFYPFVHKIFDSSDISPREWQMIKEKICELQNQGVNKFLILHGTDTMCYTASALSLAVNFCTIVLTGSQKTLDDDDFDGFDNIHLAAEFLVNCKDRQNGVFIAFANDIIPAAFCHKQNASDLRAFCDTRSGLDKTRHDFYCGNIDLSKANLDNVAIIRLNPISQPCLNDTELKKEYVLVFGFGSGNVPRNFKENLKQKFKSFLGDKRPIIIAASTCEIGLKAPSLYETGLTELSKVGFSVFSQGEFSEEFIITLLAMNGQIKVLNFLKRSDDSNFTQGNAR